ncbi:hypothetical protein AB0M87_30680 [Streptomyces sp. NPDC051320]|uniref:hypothetical protein n=1 Tax=Streptomyces sp. NPDC051320 TaxID=3154644 RepID=UPI00341B780F
MSVDHDVDRVVEVAREPVQEAAHHLAVKLSAKTMKCVRPSVLVADVAFSPPLAFALARISGQISACQRATASESCSTARVSERWKESPHRFRYLPTPG